MLGKQSIIEEDHTVLSGPQSVVYSHNKVFNLKRFGPTLHVRILLEVFKYYHLVKIYNTDTLEAVTEYTYDALEHPWVDVSVSNLNLAAGLHTYTLEFINAATGDSFYQYFNYVIQDDNPEKPYIYMSR